MPDPSTAKFCYNNYDAVLREQKIQLTASMI